MTKPEKEITVGEWIRNASGIKGRMLNFQEIESFIGKKVLYESSTASNKSYKVVVILDYFKDCDKVYARAEDATPDWDYGEYVNGFIHDVCMPDHKKPQYVVDHICDRIGYSDSKKNQKKANSWISEMYCNGGRWKPISNYPVAFYEFLEVKDD